MEMMAFQFCSGALIPKGATLAGPVLKDNEALLLMGQPFAYKGARDAVRVRVQFMRGGKTVETSASLPINSALSKTAFRFPMTGQWFAAVGPTPHTAHRWALPEEFAFDIVRMGDGTRSFRGDGTKFEDYYAYGAEILAAADGKVVAVKTDVVEDAGHAAAAGRDGGRLWRAVRRVSDAAGGDGHQGDRGELRRHRPRQWRVFALCSPQAGQHDREGRRRGQAGQPIAKLGSSGNSTEPHLHFQVCDRAEPLNCAGIPINFTNIELPYADYPRPLQSGDIVIAK